jgi:RNA polymerase sigma factor (TIGR02999 family)
LVHEAYVKLIPQRVTWQNRCHFFGIVAQQMRRILVDYARKQNAAKRGGSERKLQLKEPLVMACERPGELVAVREALERFRRDHRKKSRVVELRFFWGFTEEEIARLLGVKVEIVRRDWRFAKAWLANELRRTDQK